MGPVLVINYFGHNKRHSDSRFSCVIVWSAVCLFVGEAIVEGHMREHGWSSVHQCSICHVLMRVGEWWVVWLCFFLLLLLLLLLLQPSVFPLVRRIALPFQLRLWPWWFKMTSMYTFAFMHMYMYMDMDRWMCACACLCENMYMCMYMFMCVNVCVYICARVCLCVCVYSVILKVVWVRLVLTTEKMRNMLGRENSGEGSFSISTGKPFFILGYWSERQIEPYLTADSVRSFPQDKWSSTALSGIAMI